MMDDNTECNAQTIDGAMVAPIIPRLDPQTNKIVWPEGYWPNGKWNQAFVRKHAKAIHDLCVAPFVDGGRKTEDESVWEPGSAAWDAVETANAKFLEKNGGKPGGAAKWLTKPNGLRDIYMQMYTLDPTCTLAKRKLNGYLDEKLETFDRIGDNDPHARALRRMVKSFRGDDKPQNMKETNRFRFLVFEQFEKTDASKQDGVPKDHDVVLMLKNAPWSVAQYKCLGEHPGQSKERMANAKAKSEASAALSGNSETMQFGEEIVDVMVRIAAGVCDEVEQKKRDGALDTAASELKQLIADLIYLAGPYNSCGRPEDLTPGKALCGDGTTVAGTLDQASTMDSDGLCVRIHWINKTRIVGTKSACVLPPAVAQRLFKCLGEIWSIAMPLYSANPNWVTETMSPHFKSPHSRWATLREVLGDETTFTAYNLKHLSVSLLKRIFKMNNTDKAIETLQQIQCNHANGDATREYKTVSFAHGATFTVDRHMFLGADGKICVNALTGDDIFVTTEHGAPGDEGPPSSSDGDDGSAMSSGDSSEAEPHVAAAVGDVAPAPDEPPTKRRKVNSDKYATNDHYSTVVDSWLQSGIECEWI